MQAPSPFVLCCNIRLKYFLAGVCLLSLDFGKEIRDRKGCNMLGSEGVEGRYILPASQLK